jgi:hypothetical protein
MRGQYMTIFSSVMLLDVIDATSLAVFLGQNRHNRCASIHWRSESDPEVVRADWQDTVCAISYAAISDGADSSDRRTVTEFRKSVIGSFEKLFSFEIQKQHLRSRVAGF